jgi:hypothetical protein
VSTRPLGGFFHVWPTHGLGGFVPDCSPRQNGNAAKQEIIMRCKDGDLAIIVQDFEGCEGNLGVIVRVIGPATTHPATTMVCWQINPIKRRKLWLAGEPNRSEFISKMNPAFHPDPWLLPIKGEPKANESRKKELVTG